MPNPLSATPPLGDSDALRQFMQKIRQREFVEFRSAGPWQPSVNVYEDAGHFHVCVELAGIDDDAIEIECSDSGSVALSGRRDKPIPEESEDRLSIHVMEIDEGAFKRHVELPEPINVDAVEAVYEQGYLWIRLPKAS